MVVPNSQMTATASYWALFWGVVWNRPSRASTAIPHPNKPEFRGHHLDTAGARRPPLSPQKQPRPTVAEDTGQNAEPRGHQSHPKETELLKL